MKASRLHEIDYPYLELKSTWDQKYGKDISAIANHESLQGGWLIIGIDDKGSLLHHHKQWAKKTEEEISQQINQFLSPYQAIKDVIVKKIRSSYCIFLDIQNPGDVTEWKGEAYRRSGTSSTRMKSDEHIALAMKLPGEDFSNQPWDGPTDPLLISSFAQKMANVDPSEFPKEDLSTLSSSDVLARLGLKDKMAAGILFGNFPVRIARYDSNDDIIENTEKKGVYHILTDDFIAQIQTWTKKQGTILKGHTTSVTEEYPYPPKVIREVLANAVAHALYQREQGAIIVDISPDHLTVRNNALLEAKIFVKQWFAKNTYVKNKLLMTILRAAKITDELGTGKTRIFRLIIESGRREPTIEFSEHPYFGKWKITIYNNQKNKNLKSLMDQFHQYFPKVHARIAMALVRLTEQGHQWPSILERLDDYYKGIAFKVIEHSKAPIIIIDDKIFLRRWVDVALTGQASQSFTLAEEKQIEDALRAFAFQHSTEGFITTSEARELIGLSDSPSEATQLSNLFRKWRDKKIVKYIKRGHWQFVSSAGRKRVMMPSRL